jgi:hypothetical protein
MPGAERHALLACPRPYSPRLRSGSAASLPDLPVEQELRHLDQLAVFAEWLAAGTALEARPGDRAERFHGDRSQPAAGRA